MYTLSMSYTFDNFTNTGLIATLALNKNWFAQLGITTGTEAMPWHVGENRAQSVPESMFPGRTMLKDLRRQTVRDGRRPLAKRQRLGHHLRGRKTRPLSFRSIRKML